MISNDMIFKENLPIIYPGKRFVARLIDLLLSGVCLLWLVKDFEIFRILPYGVAEYLFFTLTMVFYMFLEPLLLIIFGTTFGKWIMGFQPNPKVKKMTYKIYLKRSFLIFVYGFGCNIPLYNLICLQKRYLESRNLKQMPWDIDSSGLFCSYFSVKISNKSQDYSRVVCSTIIILLCICGIGALSFYFKFPLYRGDVISKSEYVNNVNHLLDKGFYDETGYRMNFDGEWIRDSKNTSSSLSGYYTMDLIPHEIYEVNGNVEKIVVQTKSVLGFNSELALRAFLMADEKINSMVFFDKHIKGITKSIMPSEYIYQNYKLSLDVELTEKQNPPTYIFTIEKIK